ncbi:MAG: tol-pal system YbgF family protein [Candidatus Binatia bacterium]
MARQRFRRKDLKRPDEFISLGRQVLTWATENARVMSWGLAAGAAVVLLIMGGFSIRNARVRQANEDLGRALADFYAGNYTQAATQLNDVASRWQSTAAGRVAALYAANADLKSGNLENAVVVLQEFLGSQDWPSYLRQEALVALGFAFERKADMVNAAARYQEAGGLDGPYKAAAVLGEGRCREQMGEKDKARELYQRFTHDFPDASETELVAAKLQLLPAAS